ncbi:histidine phosphatase superfamily [Dipodascopsis tothii]|uniref:histidine phosphatase superfamily n=1 Tax=Dipodascopsis tothii TaxID=44089 RepID=UPI0034CD72D4
MVSASILLAGAVAATVVSAGKPYTQESNDEFNVLRHLGGTGPWIQHTGYGLPRDPPGTCKVDQVHMIARHGERYQTTGTGATELAVVQRLQSSGAAYVGPLAFLEDYVWPSSADTYETESVMGPYAGTLDAFRSGADYRARYNDLYDDSAVLPVWTAGQERVVVTARNFAAGFVGANYSTKASIQVIPETSAQGANSLTVSDGCLAFNQSQYSASYNSFADDYATRAADRINKQSPGFGVTAADVPNLMALCGFELNIRGADDFCKLFTTDEWKAFSYMKDLSYYYQVGQGNNLTNYIGSVYANATATLLNQGPSVGKIFWSFTHDNDLISIAHALGLFETQSPLDPKNIDFGSVFRSSEIVPMGGRITMERLTCDDDSTAYVRILVNEAVIPIPACKSGPGYSCPVADFKTYINKRAPGSYGEHCGLPTTVPWHLWFFWNWTPIFSNN